MLLPPGKPSKLPAAAEKVAAGQHQMVFFVANSPTGVAFDIVPHLLLQSQVINYAI